MGLDCIPRRCLWASVSPLEIPDGQTHPDGTTCPFNPDALSTDYLAGGCCWLRGKIAARELEALHEERLAENMFTDMMPDEALAFALKLRVASDNLEARHRDDDPMPRGAGWGGHLETSDGETVWSTYSTFEEALTEIRNAASWYEKVGAMGYGVHAWF